MNALLIIDIQNDFLPGGTLAVGGGDAIIAVINALQPDFDLVVATQDWHPADHGSFASQHPEGHVFQETLLGGLPQVLWPDHCIQGSSGAALSPALSTHAVSAIFRKGMDSTIDSYSAFYDNGQRKSTGLASYLKGQGVEDVFICGLAADYCVYYSALDSLALGFNTTILEGATRAIDQDDYTQKKATFIALGGSLQA